MNKRKNSNIKIGALYFALILLLITTPKSLQSQEISKSSQIKNILKNSEERQITTNSSDDISPRILSIKESENKTISKLIFSSNRESNYNIYIKDLATEKTSRITTDPNDQYSPFWVNSYGENIDDELIGYTTNSSDVLGDIFFSELKSNSNMEIIEKNSEKITFAKGNEQSGKKINDRLYYISSKKNLKYRNLNNDAVPAKEIIYFNNFYNIKKKITSFDILEIDDNHSKCIFVSQVEDKKINFPLNNLYIADLYLENDSLKNIIQLTYGQNIIKSVNFSDNGKFIIFDTKSRDTNKDKILSFRDNSILYLIQSREDNNNNSNFNFFTKYQLTLENYSSTDPVISGDGKKIYFVSNKKGNKDIYEIDIYGSVPIVKDLKNQYKVANYLYNEYKLNEIETGKSIKNNGFLHKTILAYQRVTKQFYQLKKEEREKVENIELLKKSYLLTAEIYEILEEYKKSENIYSIIQSKFNKDDEKTSALAGAQKQRIKMKRKKIALDIDGYELDIVLKHLIKQNLEFKGNNEHLSYLIAEIYYKLKKFNLSIKYLNETINTRKDNEIVVKSLFMLAKISRNNGEFNTSLKFLKEALSLNILSVTLKEELIKYYYTFSFEKEDITSTDLEKKGKVIQNINRDLSLSIELHTFGDLILAIDFINSGKLLNIETAIELFDKIKLTYIKNKSNNKLLKLYSAMADLELTNYYLKTRQYEEVTGVLKFSIKNYDDINIRYGYFARKSKKMLSNLYLTKANDKLSKNKFSLALIDYLEVVELDENNIDAYRGVVICYQRENKIDYAINYLQEKLEEDRNNAYLNYALGYAYSFKSSSIISNKNNGRYELKTIFLSNNYLSRSIELNSKIRYAYLTLSFNYETLHNLQIKKEEEDKNLLLEGFNYIINPLIKISKVILFIDEEPEINYLDLALNELNKAISISSGNNNKIKDKLYYKLLLNRANIFYEFGEFGREQALEGYKKILNSTGTFQFSSKRQKAIIYERIGRCYFTLDNAKASDFYNQSANLFKELDDRDSEIRVLLRNALLFLNKYDEDGDLIGGDDAASKYKEIIVKLKSEGKEEAIRILRRNIGYAFLIDLEPDLSKEELEKVIPEYESEDIGYKVSNEYIIFSFFGLNIPIWEFALQIGSANPYGFSTDEELALLYSMQVNNFISEKDFKKVVSYLKKKLSIYEKKENRYAIGLILNRLGLVNYFLKDYVTSKNYFEKSLNIAYKNKFRDIALLNINNIMKCELSLFSSNSFTTRKEKVEKFLKKYTKYLKKHASKLSNYEMAVFFNLKSIYHYKLSQNLIQENNSRAVDSRLHGNDRNLNDKKWNDNIVSSTYDSFRELIKSEKESKIALDYLQNKNRISYKKLNKESKILKVSIIYNLASIKEKQGYITRAKELIKEDLELCEQLQELDYLWRLKFKMATLENNNEKVKLKYLLEAEKNLAEILPDIETYELYMSWKDDILPLYNNIISIYAGMKDYKKAINYIERYKNRKIINSYSSKHLELKLQTHIAHIIKIRDNNKQILLKKSEIERLKSKKKKEKYENRIKKLESDVFFFKNESQTIFKEIKKKDDNRLLQFVTVADIDFTRIRENFLTDDETAILVYHEIGDSLYTFVLEKRKKGIKISFKSSLKKETLGNKIKDFYTHYDKYNEKEVATFRKQLYSQYIFPVESIIEEKEKLYLIFGYDNSVNTPVNLISSNGKSPFYDDFSATKILSLSSFDFIDENKNINNSLIKDLNFKTVKTDKNEKSSIVKNDKDFFEQGGFLTIDHPIKNGKIQNSLDNLIYTFDDSQKDSITIKDLLKYKISDYLAMIKGFEEFSTPDDKILLLNNLVYSGIPTVIIPSIDLFNKIKKSDIYSELQEYIYKNIQTKKIDEIFLDFYRMKKKKGNLSLKDELKILSFDSYGSFGLNKNEQKKYAKENLNDFIQRGIRFYKIKRYKEAVFFFNAATVMAKRINDTKSLLNILDVLSKANSKLKNYEVAIELRKELLNIYTKNKITKKIISNYDLISKDFYRNTNYDSSIVYQQKILDMISGKDLKNKLKSYNFLTVIYSAKKSYRTSVYYILKYLHSLKLISIAKNDIPSIKKFKKNTNYSTLVKKVNNSIFIENGKNDKRRKTLFKYLKLAAIQFYKNNEFDKALEVFSLLENNMTSFGSEVKAVDKGKLLESAGLCYFKKEFYKKSENYYDKAIKYYSKKSNLNQIHQNYADLFYKSNNIERALSSIKLARKFVSKRNHLAIMKVNNTEALIYTKLKKYEKAKSFSYDALEQAILAKNRFEEATARVNLTKILVKLNDFEQVEKMLETSKKLALDTDNMNALISTYYYKGEVYNRNAVSNNKVVNSDSAKVYYKKALIIAKDISSKNFEAKILLKLGERYSLSNNNKEKDLGEKYLKDCIHLSEFYNFKDLFYKVHLIYSQYLISSNRISEAKLNLSLLIDVINQDILYTYDNSLPEELFDTIEDIFTIYISLLASQQNSEISKDEDIFELMQQKENFKIQDMMNNMNLNFVDFNMNFYYNNMMYSKNRIKSLKSSYINSVQFKLKTKQDSLLKEISNENIIYNNLTINSPTHKKLFTNNILSFENINKNLSDEDAFITFYGSSSTIYCFIFTKNGIKKISITEKATDIEKIIKLNNYLNNSLDITAISKELSSLLIEPMYPIIKSKKNLIFYSNIDILNNFPFDLLILNGELLGEKILDNNNNNNNDNKFLIDHFNIAQLGYLFEIDNKKNVSTEDKKYDKIYSFVNAYSAVTEDLKFADKEFSSLKWEYEIATDYSSKKAKESTFYNLSLSNSENDKKEKQLFHFPTHTFINKKDTLESYISLVSDKNFDGKLGYSEILEYDNRNRDIVLSGCETGGKIGYDYKKYYDISSAFILSGSESVISTRWKANDLVTAVLMKRYFRYLKEGNSKIEALSKAKRVVKNFVKSYPYYWAGFKVSGDFR